MLVASFKMNKAEQKKKQKQKEVVSAAMDAFMKARLSGEGSNLGSIAFEHAKDGPVCVVDNWEAHMLVSSATTGSGMKIAVRCPHCERCPCVLNVDDNYETLMDIGASLEEEGNTNKQIQFKLYIEAARMCFGRLGKGNRRVLPNCVTGEIHDAYPEKDGKYVGFRETDIEVECQE